MARAKNPRRGTTAVELAFILPVLLLVFYAIIEFGHAYMTTEVIKTAARKAARYGVSDGKTSADVIAEARRLLSASMPSSVATIYVKNGAMFENAGASPPSNYSTLPNVEVSSLESREMFVVRIEVPYNSISLFPVGAWNTHVHNLTLTGQAIVRHE